MEANTRTRRADANLNQDDSDDGHVVRTEQHGGASPATAQILASGPLESGNIGRPAGSLNPSPVNDHDRSEKPESGRSSFSHWGPEAGFAHIDGDVDGAGYNETKVDIITVPCPGADPVETWTRDPLSDDYFGSPSDYDLHGGGRDTVKELAGDVILTPAISHHLPRAGHLWVRQGIRKHASTARTLLYKHRELAEGVNLDVLAQDLVDHVMEKRQGLRLSRPVFFIAHSLGGLVVKLALLKASKVAKYRPVLYNCHGITFFATPHRGSSYMSMASLRESMRVLMHLQHPLPRMIADNLRLGDKTLQKMHEEFIAIASEMRIWTFYETFDSLLSGGAGLGFTNTVQFSAPLVSIRSALVGVRQETVYSSLESDHANCASFGLHNPKTMAAYLDDLSRAINKAAKLSQWIHTPLKLREHVKVELIGFYEDPDTEMDSAIRLYFTKHQLADFLGKGPERCLEERLTGGLRRSGDETRPDRDEGNMLGMNAVKDGGKAGSGVLQSAHKTLKPGASDNSQRDDEGRSGSPGIIVTRPTARPPVASQANLLLSGRQRPHSLTVPSLSAPSFRRPSSTDSSERSVSTGSHPTAGEISPRDKQGIAAREAGDVATRSMSAIEQMDFDPVIRSRAEKGNRASVLRELTAGFSRPDPNKRRFMWIHTPFTNPPWVKDIFDKLSETHGENFAKLFNNEHWVSRHVQGRHSQTQPSFVRPACSYIPADLAPSPRDSPSFSRASPACLYLYLPYLHFDIYVNVIKRRRIMSRRMRHGRVRPVPKDIADLDSLELKVIWQYLGYDPPLNCRRTLDQFGYPSLRDTYARDDDQMLYKLTKEGVSQQAGPPPKAGMPGRRTGSASIASTIKNRPAAAPCEDVKGVDTEIESSDDETEPDTDLERDVHNGNVLMVDQLWLWAIDTTTLTTFFPKRESRPVEGPMFQQADLRNSVYNELNGDLTGRCENALDLAAFITLHAVTVLLDRASHPDLEVFRVFEEAIGVLTERMTSNMKRFRMQTFREIIVDDSDYEDPDDTRPQSIKKRHKRELERAERDNRENTSALLELRDMEDELGTLQRLFETQTQVVERMRAIYLAEPLKGLTQHGRAYLNDALARLDEYKTQTAEMLKRVDTTRKDYEKMLEMAQRQAQVDDVRWSRLQTELASSQNLSVMIFTTFTVIFLPLSFFTGVFGMNTLQWAGEGGTYPTLGFVLSISLPVSAGIIAASLVAAFSTRVQAAVRGLLRRARGALAGAARMGAETVQPEAVRAVRARRRRREAREEREDRDRRRKDRSYDFWATVRRQRGSSGAYQIPDLNRKSSGKGAPTKRGTWRSG